MVIFDRHRQVIQWLGDEMATMTRDALQQVSALLVERVETRDRRVVKVVCTGAVWSWRPRTGMEVQRPHEALSWYAVAG